MSGHSKWSTIKRKKGAIDAKRGALFSKLTKEIYAAAKAGGAEPETNFRLRIAILNARNYNVPKENIEKAIKKSTEKDASSLHEVIYEAKGPANTAFILEALTDNSTRTVSEIRATLARNGGTMEKSGSFSYIFEKKGVIKIAKDRVRNFEDFFLEMVDLGAADVQEEEEDITVLCEVQKFHDLQNYLNKKQIETNHASLEYLPNIKVEISVETEPAVEKFIEAMESIEDVQNIYHNIS